MKIILLPGESIYAVLNGQVAHISSALSSPVTAEDYEEESCECGSPYTDCDGSDCPSDEEDGCEDSSTDEDECDPSECLLCEAEEEDDDLVDAWSLGYDQGFEDGLDFSNEDES